MPFDVKLIEDMSGEKETRDKSLAFDDLGSPKPHFIDDLNEEIQKQSPSSRHSLIAQSQPKRPRSLTDQMTVDQPQNQSPQNEKQSSDKFFIDNEP